MSCYDELREKESRDGNPPPYSSTDYPRVVRDGMRVDEIASDPAAFICHNKPRRHQGQYAEHNREE